MTNGKEKYFQGESVVLTQQVCLSKQQSSECNVLDADEKLGEPSPTSLQILAMSWKGLQNQYNVVKIPPWEKSWAPRG